MTTNPSSRFSSQQLAVGFGVLFFSILLGCMYLLASSTVSGRDFSPELFQERSFSYWRLPGTKIRLSKTTLGPAVSPCSKHILNNLSASTQTITWQVLEAKQGQVSDSRGPSVLLSYLRAKNANGDAFWDDWSFQNPGLARKLWPIIQQVAQHELYFLVPELLREAQSSSTPSQLNKSLKLICLKAVAMEPKQSNQATDSKVPTSEWVKSFASDIADDADVIPILEQFR
jgi:hypothetical protein